MEDCFTVDHQERPTFEEVVPRVEKLLSDVHKQYYDMVNERFKKECQEVHRGRVAAKILEHQQQQQQQRESNNTNNPLYTKQTSLQPAAVATPAVKPSAQYLEPIQSRPNKPQAPLAPTSNDGYVEPLKKNVPIANKGGYLQPSSRAVPDTYGGDSGGVSLVSYKPLSEGDTYSNVRDSSSNRNTNQGMYLNEGRYMNEGDPSDDQQAYAGRLSSKIDFIDTDETGPSSPTSPGYLMPRLGSGFSTASSTAPLIRNSKPPAKLVTSPPDNSKASYIPPPANLLPSNELSLLKPPEETEV